MAIVGARGPEDQERCVLLTHMVFDPLSSWPSFCLLGINFHPVPLVIPMTMSQSPVLRVRLGGLARGPEHRWPTHPQVGPLMEDINSTSQDVDRGCSTGKQRWPEGDSTVFGVFPKGYLAKELRTDCGVSRCTDGGLTWRGNRGKIGLRGKRPSLLWMIVQRNRSSEPTPSFPSGLSRSSWVFFRKLHH